jgi:hypothetical protein
MPSTRTSARARCGNETVGNRRAAHVKAAASEKADEVKALQIAQTAVTESVLSCDEENGECENIFIGDLNDIYQGTEALFPANAASESMHLFNVTASTLNMQYSIPSDEVDKKIGQDIQSSYVCSYGASFNPVDHFENIIKPTPRKRAPLDDTALETSNAEMDACCDRAILLMKRDQSTLTFEEQREIKKYMRQLKNRESAQLSRHRKKLQLSALEQQVVLPGSTPFFHLEI